nr:NADH dehydrogenase subunit 6 [Candidula unifasciata unifasciata]
MLSTSYEVIFIGLVCSMAYYMLYTTAPVLLGMTFMLVVCMSTYFLFVFMDALMAYMLFLVYVGGLLVLITYMIMVSTNFFPSGSRVSSILMLFMVMLISSTYMMLFCTWGEMKYLEGAEMLYFSTSSLIILGVMLLYVFLGVCTSIIVGGRTLTFGMQT